MKAAIISDGSPCAVGVVVRFTPGRDDIEQARKVAVAALAEFGDEYGDKLTPEAAAESLGHMTYIQVDAFRWVPMRDDEGYQGKQLDHAEPGSRGSWLGIYWSYPW